MREEQFNAKKIKVMAERSSEYRDRTIALKKTNKIWQDLARAEVTQVNMDIMSRNPDDLPDNISHEFLQLQKQIIIESLREQIKEKQKEKEKQNDQENSMTYETQTPASSSIPPSNPEGLDGIGSDDDEEEDAIDPALS